MGSDSEAGVMGDSEREVLANISAAKAAGVRPAFIQIDAPEKTYTFSVYAQLLRTGNALIVRAYGHAYAFPLKNVRVLSGDQGLHIDPIDLPLVSAPRIDHKIAMGATPGNFTEGDVSGKKSLCPDCVVFFGHSEFTESFAKRWNGVVDPWQQSPRYAPWSPSTTLAGVKSRSAVEQTCTRTYQMVHGTPSYSDPLISSDCYSTIVSGTSVGGGGGGGVEPTSTPTPKPLKKGCNKPSKSTTANEVNTAREAMAAAYAAAQAQSPAGSNGVEALGYVVEDSSGTISYTDPNYSSLNSAGKTSLPPEPPNVTVVGIYHTHPDLNPQDPGNGVDNTTGTHFSVSDENAAFEDNVPIFVEVDVAGMGGQVSSQQYEWTPATSTTGTETSLGTTPTKSPC